MFQRRNDWAIATGSVSVAFYVSALVANVWKAWLSLALGLTFTAFTIGLVMYARPGRPRLFVGEPACFERDLVSVQSPGFVRTPHLASASVTAVTTTTTTAILTGGSSVIDRLWCVYAHVWNEPVRGHDTARDVFAKITFARNGENLHVMPARWSHTPQTFAAESLQVVPQINVPPNTSRWELDVAFKRRAKDDQCYAVNDQTRFDSADWRSVPLGNGPIDVTVECFGTGCRATSTFVLTANGPDVEPTFVFIRQERSVDWLVRFLRWVGADGYTKGEGSSGGLQ